MPEVRWIGVVGVIVRCLHKALDVSAKADWVMVRQEARRK